jgi:hypothetical protein
MFILIILDKKYGGKMQIFTVQEAVSFLSKIMMIILCKVASESRMVA